MNHRRQLYDADGQRVYLVKELKTVFGYNSRTTQMEDCLIVNTETRYGPDKFRFACSLPLRILHNGKLRNPIMFVSDDYIEGLLDVHFGTETTIETMLGQFDSGRQLFIPVDDANVVQEAPHVLIKIRWNNADTVKGKHYAEINGAIEYCSITNNNGRHGCDYWVIPIDRIRKTSKVTEVLAFFSLHATKIAASFYGHKPARTMA